VSGARGCCARAGRHLRALELGRAARRSDSQRRRSSDGAAARHCLLSAEIPKREAGGAGRRLRDLRLGLRRALRNGPAPVQPQAPSHLWVLAAAGIVLLPRQRAGGTGAVACRQAALEPRRLSPTAITPVSTASSRLAWLRARSPSRLARKSATPIVGLVITLVILKITRDSWRTATTTEPCELDEH
jgi:hypothetical protein